MWFSFYSWHDFLHLYSSILTFDFTFWNSLQILNFKNKGITILPILSKWFFISILKKYLKIMSLPWYLYDLGIYLDHFL